MSDLRSDAILITSEGIRCLPLDRLDHATIQKKAQTLVRYTEAISDESYMECSRALLGVLEWLWDDLVEPILIDLGLTGMPGEGEAWPRVWWVPTGVLSILPIHAAGYHNDKDPGRAAMDRVVSSYAPTVTGLANARSCIGVATGAQKPKAMLVAMPETPGERERELEFAEDEVNTVRALISPCDETYRMEKPTKAGVLAALKEYEMVHIVCHGRVSMDDPSLSKIFLTDWEEDPLTASDIAKIRAGPGQFVFLAACDTSSARELKLLDESIHLSSSLPLAGFPSIIGTLWSILDESSVGIAREVYEGMLETTEDGWHQGQHVNTRLSAMALHHALRSVRKATFDRHKAQ